MHLFNNDYVHRRVDIGIKCINDYDFWQLYFMLQLNEWIVYGIRVR